MAKRKRLSPAQTDYLAADRPQLETKSMPLGGGAPIAQVAGETSARAALEALAGEMRAARDEGRLIQTLDAALIDTGYLVRDRLAAEDAELQALMESLRARGQQTPVEVVALDGGRFGLISGWRRLTALRRLLEETGEARFGTVQAILRRPDTAAEAYVAMVEENEIRVGLSYYERARVAAKAVEHGVFDSEKSALLTLYAAASRAKRSKIRSFLALYHAADDLLRFPAAVGERLGLSLAKALEGSNAVAEALQTALTDGGAGTVEEEQAVLRDFVSDLEADEAYAPETETPSPALKPSPPRNRAMPQGVGEVAPGISARWSGRSLTLSGPGMSEALRQDLFDWIRRRS